MASLSGGAIRLKNKNTGLIKYSRLYFYIYINKYNQKSYQYVAKNKF